MNKPKENILINKWKEAVSKLQKSYKIEAKLQNTSNPFDLKMFAQRQLEMCTESRPDKTKTIWEQANETQTEYFKYLEKVIETGQL